MTTVHTPYSFRHPFPLLLIQNNTYTVWPIFTPCKAPTELTYCLLWGKEQTDIWDTFHINRPNGPRRRTTKGLKNQWVMSHEVTLELITGFKCFNLRATWKSIRSATMKDVLIPRTLLRGLRTSKSFFLMLYFLTLLLLNLGNAAACREKDPKVAGSPNCFFFFFFTSSSLDSPNCP